VTPILTKENVVEPEDRNEELTEEEFLARRAQLRNRLTQLCAVQISEQIKRGSGNAGHVLLEARINNELANADVQALVLALVNLGVIDGQKFAVTAYQILLNRVQQLESEQSKIVVARGRIPS